MEVTSPKDHISHTQIDMFKRCARQYYYRYVEDRIIPPKWIMPVGKAGHKAMEFNNNNKMKTGIDAKKTDVVEVFTEEWKKEKASYEKIIYGDVKEKDIVPLMEKPINEYFIKGTFREDIPTAVEKEFALRFEDINIDVVGYIDVEFNGEKIYDYKFSQKSPSIQKIFAAEQLRMYSASHIIETNKSPKKVGFTYLISTKIPQIKVYDIPYNNKFMENFYEDLKESLITISNAMKSGTFIRNSSSFMCNPKDCGYWDICKPGQKKLYFELESKYTTKKKG